MSRRSMSFNRQLLLESCRKRWVETGSLYDADFDARELEHLFDESGLDPDANMRPSEMLVSSQYGVFETNIPACRDLRSRAAMGQK